MNLYATVRALCWVRSKPILSGNSREISVSAFLGAVDLDIYPRTGGARFGITIFWWPDLQQTRDGLGAIGCHPAGTHDFKHFWGYTQLRGNRRKLIAYHRKMAEDLSRKVRS